MLSGDQAMNKGKVRVNNIFKYATSELSQDAFICWLLSHLTEAGWLIDAQIRECAISFMNKILGSKGYYWNQDMRITAIHKQYKTKEGMIDVLVEVDDLKIIIEDKTFTCSHGNQVNRYKKYLLDEGVAEKNIICVFYKIEEQDSLEPNVDFEFTRKILLGIFRPYGATIQNTIFTDYLEYLEWIDGEVDAWKVLPIKQWNGRAYIGFFTHLKDTILNNQVVGWGYVHNKEGGFMGLWWVDSFTSQQFDAIGFTEDIGEEIYIQFEDNKIVVKYSKDPQKNYDTNAVRSMRWKIYMYFKQRLAEKNCDFNKKVFRQGNCMTVGYVEYDESNYEEKLMLVRHTLEELLQNGF